MPHGPKLWFEFFRITDHHNRHLFTVQMFFRQRINFFFADAKSLDAFYDQIAKMAKEFTSYFVSLLLRLFRKNHQKLFFDKAFTIWYDVIDN